MVADLRLIEDPHERLSVLVEQGQAEPGLPAGERVTVNKVPGCVSEVFLVRESLDGRCHYRVDSGSGLIKGLAGLFCKLYRDRKPEEILADPDGLIEEIGLDHLVTPNRLEGIRRVRASMLAHAAERMEGAGS